MHCGPGRASTKVLRPACSPSARRAFATLLDVVATILSAHAESLGESVESQGSDFGL
jgi:hypothetical protein